MSLSRRTFVRRAALTGAAGMIAPRPGYAGALGITLPEPDSIERDAALSSLADPDLMRQLATRAIDAARHAGAEYADVRITRTIRQSVNTSFAPSDSEELAIGVRCLVRGYWGFAASPYWDLEEPAVLARNAMSQATANALGSPRRVELGRIPVASGSWATPVKIDPFAVPVEEKLEFMRALYNAIIDRGRELRPAFGPMFSFRRQERAVATTEGSYFTQTTFLTDGMLALGIDRTTSGGRRQVSIPINTMAAAGAGWEHILDARLFEMIPAIAEQLEEWFAAPQRPVEPGRYDVICDAVTTAALVDRTLGVATELDRALGYEANAGGTSYLGPDPLSLIGTFAAGSPLLTVTADRSAPGGAATVRWDDEGVVPEEVKLVTNGTLTDFQTTREGAGWLAPYYQKRGVPGHSHGHASAESALSITTQHAPNLRLEPSRDETTLDSMIASTSKGMVVYAGGVSTDFQAKNGIVAPHVLREVKNGRLGAIIPGGSWLFGSVELWKNLTALGGARSVERSAAARKRGQPTQETTHSISAGPTTFSGATIVDARRRA